MIPIPGRLHSVAVGEPVSGADEVLDDALNMEQSKINQLTVGTKNASTGTTGAYPYNGMGRVVLPKNMVNGVNTLTQDMLYKGDPGSRVPNTNTIFVIQYDFILGEDITIPANCVLDFQGGSISGGIVFSNKTIISGNPKIEKYFGAFKDCNGNWLDQDFMPFNIVRKKDGAITGRNFAPYPNTVPFTTNQSIAEDENYIYLAQLDMTDYDQSVDEYKVVIAITDKNYNPIGTTKLNYYGHANGVTVEDGYLLIPGRVNQSYYKVATNTVVTNAENSQPTTTGEVIDVNSILQNLCYDPRTELILEEKDEERYLYIYDSSGNLIKKLNNPADYYCPLDNFGGRQQVCLVNGIIYHLFIGNAPMRGVLSVIDASSEELICHYYLDHDNYEVEGICFQDGIFRLSYNKILSSHVEVSPITIFYKMSSHGSNFVATEDFVNKNSNKVTVYVDNTYTGIQRGSAQAPFNSLINAMELTNGINKVNIYINASNTPYQAESDAYIEELYIKSTSNNKNDVTLTGRINFFGRGITADYITFDGIDKNLRGIVSNASESSVVLSDCTLKNLRECVTHLHQYGGIAINNSLIQNCNWGARGSDITMTISGCTVSGGNLCDSKGRIEYRNNTYSDGVQISNEGQFPHIICNSSTEVGKFFKHYLEGDAKMNNDGLYVDVVHSVFGSGDTNFGGVRWAKCSFKFVPYSDHGIISHVFPIYRLNEINALDNSNPLYKGFKELFNTSFTSQFDTPGYSSRYGVTRLPEDQSYLFIETLGGKTAYNKRGTTRPTLYLDTDIGNDFFDETINKMIYWTGDTSGGKSGWVDATGTPV